MVLQNLRRLRRAGIDEAVVNLHYRPEMLRALLGEGESEGLPKLHYTHEDPILGTGGGLRNAA